MAFDYINEAFKRLDTLEESLFDTSYKGINNLAEFVAEDDEVEETVRVIDPNAVDEDDIEDSYIGKIIVNCNVCHSHIFENRDDIAIDEDGAVNSEVPCPYCGESEGFTIVGEIAPFDNATEVDTNTEENVVDTENSVETAESEDNIIEENLDDENTSLSMSRATKRLMSEDFKEVSIKTDDQKLEMTSDENGKVTVVTEPVAADTPVVEDETIVPVSDETQDNILANNTIEEPVEDESEEDEFDDVELSFEEADEEGFDELGEGYFKRVYENVNSFKTTDVSATPTQIIVEGIIEFNSGVTKKTGFIFEAKDINSRGQLRFVGTNKHLTESADAFCLIGRVDNKKLFVESLKYNYSISDNAVRGLIRRK